MYYSREIDEKETMPYLICSVVAVLKMLIRILNTATTEQMGYGIISFFVYTKSTNSYFIKILFVLR